jgi:glycosyltransferase involved in cell wall biosynthesis
MPAAETPNDVLSEATTVSLTGAPLAADAALDLDAAAAGESPLRAQLRKRHLLLVGRDYAPAKTPIAPYTTGIAQHLATLAAGITVLTGLPEPADGPLPAPCQHGLRFDDSAGHPRQAPRVIRLRHAPARSEHPLRAAVRELGFLLTVVVSGRAVVADLVVAVTPSAGGAAAAAYLAGRRGGPRVTLVQGTANPAEPIRTGSRPRGRRARLAASIVSGLERYALQRSHEVAVTSEAFRPAVVAAGVDPEHLHLLPNWARLAPASESRLRAREALGWPVERFVVVHTGPMTHRQDLPTVIEAARLLANGGEVVDVVLVGEGSQRRALEQHAFGLENVRFLDPVHEEQPLVLAAADVMLVAESAAGAAAAPGQLAGYLSAGRPVLAAVPEQSAIAAELRRAGRPGYRVNPGDPAALAEAIIRLRAAPRQRAVMSRSALRYARAHLGREATLRRLELVVEAALRRHSISATPPLRLSGRDTVQEEAGPTSMDAGRGC